MWQWSWPDWSAKFIAAFGPLPYVCDYARHLLNMDEARQTRHYGSADAPSSLSTESAVDRLGTANHLSCTSLPISSSMSGAGPGKTLPVAESIFHQLQVETGSSCLSSTGHIESPSPAVVGSSLFQEPPLAMDAGDKKNALQLHEQGLFGAASIKMPFVHTKPDTRTTLRPHNNWADALPLLGSVLLSDAGTSLLERKSISQQQTVTESLRLSSRGHMELPSPVIQDSLLCGIY